MQFAKNIAMWTCLLGSVPVAGCRPKCTADEVRAGDKCVEVPRDVDADAGESTDDIDAESHAGDGGVASDGSVDRGDAQLDEPVDSGSDADSPMEYVLGQAGKPCPSDLEQTLACEGHASRRVLKCQQGTWQLLLTCAQTERCESRLGIDQGTCAAISSDCVGKAAGDAFCDRKKRMTCGPDLVSVADHACAPHAHCETPDASCECDDGYENDGSDGCVDIDECAAPGLCSTAYPCVQTDPPGYTCRGQFADWPMPDAVPGAKFAPSYDVDTRPGVVIDNVTALMWQRLLPGTAASHEESYDGCTGTLTSTGDSCSWPEAKRYCENLALSDETDWRLPSLIELESISDETRSKPAIDDVAFPSTPSTSFWSSSPYVGYVVSSWFPPGDAWIVQFWYAGTSDPKSASSASVRCVRDGRRDAGTPKGRYIVSMENDAVTDTRTNLVWRRTVDSTLRDRDAGVAYCEALGSSWRLPAFKELFTLVDPTQAVDKDHPAIDPIAFPNTVPSSYLSSSPSRANAAAVIQIDFAVGRVNIGTDGEGNPNPGSVRCVH